MNMLVDSDNVLNDAGVVAVNIMPAYLYYITCP